MMMNAVTVRPTVTRMLRVPTMKMVSPASVTMVTTVMVKPALVGGSHYIGPYSTMQYLDIVS